MPEPPPTADSVDERGDGAAATSDPVVMGRPWMHDASAGAWIGDEAKAVMVGVGQDAGRRALPTGELLEALPGGLVADSSSGPIVVQGRTIERRAPGDGATTGESGQLSGQGRSVAACVGGDAVMVVVEGGVELWKVSPLSREGRIPFEEVPSGLACSPGGRFLADARGGALWSADAVKRLMLEGAVTFSPDGRWCSQHLKGQEVALWRLDALEAPPVRIAGQMLGFDASGRLIVIKGRSLLRVSPERPDKIQSEPLPEVIAEGGSWEMLGGTQLVWSSFDPFQRLVHLDLATEPARVSVLVEASVMSAGADAPTHPVVGTDTMRLLQSLGYTDHVQLWGMDPPRRLARFPGRFDTIALSRSGGWALVLGQPFFEFPWVQVRRLQDGALLLPPDAHASPILAVAFGAGGDELYSLEKAGRVARWEVSSGGLQQMGAQLEGRFVASRVSLDPKRDLLVSWEDGLRAWRISDGAMRLSVYPPLDLMGSLSPNDVARSPADWGLSEASAEALRHSGAIALGVDPRGQRLVALHLLSPEVRFIEAGTGRDAGSVRGAWDRALLQDAAHPALACRPVWGGERVALGPQGGPMVLLDWSKGVSLGTIEADCSAVEISSDGARLMALEAGASVSFHALGAKSTRALCTHEGEVLAAALMPDGREALLWTPEGLRELSTSRCKPRGGPRLLPEELSSLSPSTMQVSPAGDVLAVLARDAQGATRLTLWPTAKGAAAARTVPVCAHRGVGEGTRPLRFSRGGALVQVLCEGGRLELYKAADGALHGAWERPHQAQALDGEGVATFSHGGLLEVWRLGQEQVARREQTRHVLLAEALSGEEPPASGEGLLAALDHLDMAVVVALDAGRALVAEPDGESTGTWELVDRVGGESQGERWRYDTAPIFARSADGRRLALVEEASAGPWEVSVLSTATLDVLGRLEVPPGAGQPSALAFSPNGRRLAVGTDRGLILGFALDALPSEAPQAAPPR